MLFVGIIVVFLLIGSAVIKQTTDTIVAKVTDKERVMYQSGKNIDSKYLIFTEVETFECTDQLLVGKLNSSDFYGRIKKDATYKFTVYGFRFPFLDMYRNIIGVEEVK